MMDSIYGCPKCYNIFEHPGNRPDCCSACGYEDVITFEQALLEVASYEDFRRDLMFDEDHITEENEYVQMDIVDLLEDLEETNDG